MRISISRCYHYINAGWWETRWQLRKVLGRVSSLLAGTWFGKMRLARAVHYHLKRIVDPKMPSSGIVLVTVMGHKMYVDSSDVGVGQPLLLFRAYNIVQTNHFKAQVKKGMAVLDVGANIGYFTLIAASLVGEEGKVVAFEPEPSHFGLLNRNVKANRYNNVTLVQKAVSNKTEEVKLFLQKNNLAAHQIWDPHDGSQFVTVPAITLDEYCENENLKKVDFIKIDVQGAEGAVLQGMRSIMDENRALKIVMEFWPAGMTAFGIDPKECINELTSRGFMLFDVNEETRTIHPTDMTRLMEKYSKSDTNLFCIRNYQ